MAVNWRLAPPEIAHILADADCEAVFVAADFLPAYEAPELAPWRAKLICLDGEPPESMSGLPRYDALFAQAEAWGAIQVEQDWLVECFLGVRGLREQPGRARAWQEGLDRAAAEHGLSLHWCMATPADFLQTLTLPRVEAIRTSGDYHYVLGSESLWCWFLYGNAFARALGL